MDDPARSDPAPLLDDLPDDVRGRIKAELVPGERILWVARPRPRPLRISQGYRTAGLFAAGCGCVCGLCLAGYFGAFGRTPAEAEISLVVFGLIAGSIGLFVASLAVMHWSDDLDQRDWVARQFYALTDRRALLWRPPRHAGAQQDPEAIEIHSIRRGEILHLHRIESADGSGDLEFLLCGNGREHLGPNLLFLSLLKVRRVEGLVRTTLLETAPPPEDA